MVIDFKKEGSSRKEIEEKLAGAGDYVKMDVLQRYLKQQLDFDTRKFVLLTLSSIYESRKMYLEAGKMMRNAAEINTTFAGKMSDFVKSMELYTFGGNYEEADASYNKALACGDGLQKTRIKERRKEVYKLVAKNLMGKDKRKHAMDAYEKLLEIDLTPEEKNEVKNVLMNLYEKLGKIQDYYSIKKTI
jgi:tetratricopeptide (TPR) repeat protein